MNQKPAIFDFLDAFQFLRAYYSFRKNSGSSFSYEIWAHELNLKSRSSLRMILYGQRKISPDFCVSFLRNAGLNEQEEEYFYTLVRYSQSATPSEKQMYGTKLVQILKSVMARSEINNHVDFVAKPLYVRLLTMLGFNDIEATAENLAALLDEELPVIDEALDKLAEMELAAIDTSTGKPLWKTTHNLFRVPDNIGSVPLMRFHEQSLLESIQAFHKPKEERRYRSLLLPLSQQELTEFYELMNTFASEQLARFQANEYRGRKLYQVNLNVHSVAKPVVLPEPEAPA